MSSRMFYLAAYDVADPKRLAKAFGIVKRYATGGQKSVFECWLTEAEKAVLLGSIRRLLYPPEDRFFLLRLDPRSRTRTLGLAVPPTDLSFFYQG